MKLNRILPLMLVGGLALYATSCKKKTSTPPVVNKTDTVIINKTDTVNTKDTVKVTIIPKGYTRVLTGDITASKTLDAVADSPWIIKGYVYIKDGATLTIQAGTLVKSDIVDKGALIFERGSKIMAEGTASAPIIFTSGAPKGQRRPGDWGGIILLGKASTNRSTEPTIEGGVGKQYGGNDDGDNSGSMKYCRIEFAGIAAEPGSEINGLTFGGVGSGTTIENVMVSYGNDDAFEFFGGTVNCKNLVAFACLDDDYDFDFGYRGTINNAISFKHPSYADPGDASNGIEADNDGTGTTAMPYTEPKLFNFTMVGPMAPGSTALVQANHNFGNRWRRAVRFHLTNSIMIGHQKGGFSMESKETGDAYFGGTSEFKNNLVHAATAIFKVGSGVTQTATDVENKAIADGCEKLATADDAGLEKPFDTKTPNFAPKPGGKAATKGVGAITGTDWTTGWTSFDPANNDYK